MTRLLFPLIAAGLLASCAAPRVGVANPDLLAARAPDETVPSVLDVSAFAACFQTRADFLPLSRFVATGEQWLYVLSGYGAAYESVTIRPAATGSVAEVRLGDYDRRWARTFERDRATALRACATPTNVNQ